MMQIMNLMFHQLTKAEPFYNNLNLGFVFISTEKIIKITFVFTNVNFKKRKQLV